MWHSGTGVCGDPGAGAALDSMILGIFSSLVDSMILRLTGNAFSLASGSRSSKTFKPKKNIPEGSHQYELLKHAEATLGSGNLRQAVMLPEGEDLNEWIAVNSESSETGKTPKPRGLSLNKPLNSPGTLCWGS